MTVSAGTADFVVRPLEERDAVAASAILREVDDARVLSPAAWVERLRNRSPREQAVELGAQVGDRLVAVAAAGLNVWTTTPGAAWAGLAVTASHRRRGIGSTLLDRLLDHLREQGAARATSFTRGSEETERWALAHGWERALSGPLIALDPRRVAEPSPPAGLRCVAMAEVAPEAIYETTRVAALDEPSAVPNDAFSYDDWLRDWANPDLDRDASSVVVDGELVVSFAYLNVTGDRAQHGFTGTLPDYRARGLATVAKQRALRAAAAKGVTRVTTSNAEENAAMRAVNRKLGFEPIGEHVIYARDV